MASYLAGTTVLVVAALCAVHLALTPDVYTFVQTASAQKPSGQHGHASLVSSADLGPVYTGAPVSSMRAALGINGLLSFGVAFGVAMAAVHKSSSKARRAVSMKASEEIEVAEKKAELTVPSYLENIPRTILDKKSLDKYLATVPRSQWDDPDEDSYLFTLKMYAETYGEGPGKSSKMGWWDYWYMTVNKVEASDIADINQIVSASAYMYNQAATGETAMYVPGPSQLFPTQATIKWRGPEPFAGDQCQTPVTQGAFAKQYVANMAFYREGLKPWQRGLEIGMAHGYFLIGPFVSLGPLRNTPEAATVGLLCGVAVVGIVSVGALLFGSTIKPTLFDKPGDKPASGFIEMINWHAVGGLGGAGFAHALITVFGS